jgi:lipopolysaccharide export system protein LptA
MSEVGALPDRRRSGLLLFGLLLLLGLAMGLPARAQLIDQLDSGSSSEPVAIDAQQGIEWRRDEKSYIARGDVRAVRGAMSVFADVMTADYREKPDGSTEIYRLTADGNVRMTSQTETIYGDHATYDMDKGVVVVTGEDLRVVTPNETVTAKDSLEYWDKEQVVVANGDAVVVQGEKRVRADTLTGHLEKDAAGNSKMTTVDADGDVRLSTPTEYATANQATYDLDTQIALLTGDVKVTRGKNQLNGDHAEVNMKTGVSRLLASRGERVHTLITPSDVPKESDVPGRGKAAEGNPAVEPSKPAAKPAATP